MFTRKSVLCIAVVLLAVLMMNNMASAHLLQAVLGTGFSYQGQLSDGGAPAEGVYDFEFKLYDDLSAGSQVGSTVIRDDITVTAGQFNVQLDFGDVFDGTVLYLEISERLGSETGAYTTLSPRQQLSATPYALYASKAPWSGLTGVPAGFAVIARMLEQGDSVHIPEFGRFEVTTANSRMVVSNLGGETRYQVPERKHVRFIPSAMWVDELNSEGDK